MNTVAMICIGLLGLLVIVLGFAVTLQRGRSNIIAGFKDDPTDTLYKLVRAHGNTTEYAPIIAILILLLGSQNPATWMVWTMGLTTAGRYLIAAGIIMSPDLNKPHPLRFIGALLTYLGGLALCIAVFLSI
ncbi:MAG: MAPEG family protein [Pseudomonadota bacterium]